MAVDTAVKRASVVGLAAVAITGLGFPDASVDTVDRVALAHCYAGTNFGTVSGTISSDINAIAQSAAGNVGVAGSASSDINAIAQSAAGNVGVAGTASSDINAIGQSLTGVVEVTVTATSDINAIGQDSNAHIFPVTITLSGYNDDDDGTYSVDIQFTNRTANQALLESQPWYNSSPTDEAMAQDAAGQVGFADVNSAKGPMFYWWTDQHEYIDEDLNFATLVDGSDNQNYWYAIATAVEVAAEEEVDAPSGGWAALNAYDRYRQKKRKRERERKELEEYLKSLEPVDAEIATLLHEPVDQSALALAELEQLVEQYADQIDEAEAYNQRVGIALERAARQRNYSAMMAFEREMERAREEDEFLLLVMAILN